MAPSKVLALWDAVPRLIEGKDAAANASHTASWNILEAQVPLAIWNIGASFSENLNWIHWSATKKSLSCVCWVRNRALRRFLDAWDHGPKRALTRPHVPTKYWVCYGTCFIRCELMPFLFWAVRLVGLVTFHYLLAWRVGDTYTSILPIMLGCKHRIGYGPWSTKFHIYALIYATVDK